MPGPFRLHPWFRLLAIFAFLSLIWAALLDFPGDIAADGLDYSYSQGLGYFFKNSYQAGEDYIFTYGPLGYFLHRTYDPDLFYHKLMWEGFVKLIFAIVVINTGSCLRCLTVRLAFYGTLLALVMPALQMPDALYMFVISSCGVLLIGRHQRSRVSTLWLIAILVVLSMVKFTFLLLSVCVITTFTGLLLTKSPRRRAGLPPVIYGVLFVALWLALGQRVTGIPHYVMTSFQVAFGYVDAMGLAGNKLQVYLACAIIVAICTCLLSSVRKFIAPSHVAMTCCLLCGLYLEWKHGFVRHDGHALSFFAYTALMPYLLPCFFRDYRWGRPYRVVAISSCVLLSALAIWSLTSPCFRPVAVVPELANRVARNIRNMCFPTRVRQRCERAQYALQQRWALPRLASIIGAAPVDIISYEQGVLFLNHFNWRPRPVFQSYSAYSPPLLAANGRYFNNQRAPAYVMLKVQPIDGRLASMEDSQALFQILNGYLPVAAERSYILFRRREGTARRPVEEKVVLEKRISFNQEIGIGELAGKMLRMAVKLRYSWQGKLRKILYRAPTVYIVLRTEDNECHSFRMVPGMAADYFIVSPLLESNADVVNLFTSEPGKRVRSIAVVADGNALSSFKPSVWLAIRETSCVDLPRLEPDVVNQVRYPMLESTPWLVKSSVRTTSCQVNEKEVLLVHPEGMMEFKVSGGAHSIGASYGIVPDAYEKGVTDGVLFVVEYIADGASPTVLCSRQLDPCEHPQDRGTQRMDIETTFPASGILRLRTTNRPGDTGNRDWSYWTEVKIERTR
jgi:hypothetical protein